MAEITSDVAFRISQTGANEVRQSLEGLNQTLDRSGKSTSNLTGFVREQRRENLQQNFLFRESRDAITSSTFALMSLTSATGGSSKATQQLNASLNQGFNAFQGVNFAMAGLGIATGGTALAITGLIAGGTALLKFLDDSKEKTQAFVLQMRELGKETDTFNAILKRRGTDVELFSEKRITSEINVRLSFLADIEKRQDSIARKMVDASEEEKKQLEAQVALLEKRYKGEWEFLQALIGERKERAGIISSLDQEIKIIQQKIRYATSLNEIESLQEKLERAERRREGLKPIDMGEPPLPGGWSKTTRKEIDKEIRDRERDILRTIDKSFKKTKKEVGDIDAELRKLQHDQMRFLALLDRGLGTLRTALTALGMQTDSFINKLLSALEIATSIAETIQAISTLGSFFSLFFGGVSIPMGAITTPGPILPLPKMTGGKETMPEWIKSFEKRTRNREIMSEPIATIPKRIENREILNITINAVDARSFQQMLNRPDNRRVFMNAFSNAERLGIN